MSDLLIKDMEMPTQCDDCPVFDDNGDYPTCILTGHSRGYNWSPFGQRMPDCPLTAVSPHGRLIDSDVLKKIVADPKHMDACIYNGRTLYSGHLCVGADYDDVCAAIDETPTVIE